MFETLSIRSPLEPFLRTGVMKKAIFSLILIAAFFCIPTQKAYAQDPEFTQFYANPLYLNPAFAGTGRCPRIIMNYRNQWPAISGTLSPDY